MKCNKDYDLVGFLNNEGAKEERSGINRHIGECSDCLRELADIRSTLQSIKDAPQIELFRDFTNRVIDAVRQSAPAPVGQETLLDVLKYYLKRSPPWAFSTALHVVILACLAFVFVGQAYKQPVQNDNIIHWTSLSLPKGDVAIEPVRTVALPNEDLPVGNINIDRAALVAKLRQGDDKIAGNLINRADKTKRDELLAKYGGQGTEKAVADGMKWLAGTQEPDGNWTPSKYGGRDEYTVALTGLATLGYTAQGNSHLSGAYSGTVDKSVKYLISVQQPNGLIDSAGQTLVPASVLYNHGIATYALLEDYLLAQEYADRNSLLRDHEVNNSPDLLSEILEDSVIKAVSYIIKAQGANGGWGYAKGGTPDTSVTVWQIQVLRLASVLDMDGVEEALYKSRQWLNQVTADDGLVGYQALLDYPNGPDALTAAGLNAYLMIESMLARSSIGEGGPGMGNSDDAIAKRMDGLVGKQSTHLKDRAGRKSNAGEETDLYYWYWSSPSVMAGPEWDKFNTALKDAILKNQSKQGNWPGEDQWSVYGGEIYTTSMAVLTLQVYYRNPPLRVE